MRFAGTPILSLVWGTPTYPLWIRARAVKGGMIARAGTQLGAGNYTGRSPFTVTRVPARVCGQ
jgi:hypothetical protein